MELQSRFQNLDYDIGPVDDMSYSTEVNFIEENNRLKTFEGNWQNSYSVRPIDLAKNGFIYCGPKDRVQCVFCSNPLWDWEPGDCVEREHRKYYPNCPFVMSQGNHFNTTISSEGSLRLHVRRTSERNSTKPNLFSDRLNSYQNWPSLVSVMPSALADAGFYYLGKGDGVQCFSCQAVISQWQPGDDPWFEHARWSPGCPYLLSIKGTEFVNQVQGCVISDANRSLSCAQVTMGVTEENKPAVSRSTWHEQSACSTWEVMPLQPVQERRTQIENDLRLPAVMAVMETCDIPTDLMVEQLEKIRITEGYDYNVTTDDFQDLICSG